MSKVPRNLDGVFYRVKRGGRWCNVCFSDMTADELRITAANALDENAKLRELATGLYRCWQGEECEDCPMQDDGGWCVRDIRLRELGVEVDG